MIAISPEQSLAVFAFMIIVWLVSVYCLTRPVTDEDLKKDFASRRPNRTRNRNNNLGSGGCRS